MNRLGVCTYMMMVIYMIHAANWVDLIEVSLGANVIPKGTALEYPVIIPMYSAYDLIRKNVFVLFSFPNQKTHTRPHSRGSTVA